MHTQFCNYEEMAPRQIRYPHSPVPHLQIRGKSVHEFTGSKKHIPALPSFHFSAQEGLYNNNSVTCPK